LSICWDWKHIAKKQQWAYASIVINKEEKFMKMNAWDKLAYTLVVIGGLNWGLVGFFKYNLVEKIFGAGSTGAKVVYDIVGLAALWMLYGMITMMMSEGKKKS